MVGRDFTKSPKQAIGVIFRQRLYRVQVAPQHAMKGDRHTRLPRNNPLPHGDGVYTVLDHQDGGQGCEGTVVDDVGCEAMAPDPAAP